MRLRLALAPAPAAVPPWAGVAAVGLALLAASLVAGRPVGLGVTLVAFGLCWLVARASPPVDGFGTACWVAAAALAGLATLRSAGWVTVLGLLAATLLASLAAAGGPGAAGVGAWHRTTAGALAVARHLVPGPLVVAALVAARLGGTTWGRMAPALRGVALAAGLLVVFGSLFAAADAAFAEALGRLGSVQVGAPWARAGVFLLVLALAGALLAARAGRARAATPTADLRETGRRGRSRMGRTEWLIALVALDALFAAFVALQLTRLFGGDALVARTAGLTYAEYAREGFGQLVAVAALTLGVVAAAARPDRLVRALLGALCVLCLVVLASALERLELYEAALGFTRLRVLVHVAILWLAGVLGLVLLAGAWPRMAAGLPRAVVALTALVVLGLGAADPDRRIAQANVERYERTGRIDLPYLEGLSPDAAPALVALPPSLERCVLARTRAALRGSDGLAGLNQGRRRARRTLAESAGRCAPGERYASLEPPSSW